MQLAYAQPVPEFHTFSSSLCLRTDKSGAGAWRVNNKECLHSMFVDEDSSVRVILGPLLQVCCGNSIISSMCRKGVTPHSSHDASLKQPPELPCHWFPSEKETVTTWRMNGSHSVGFVTFFLHLMLSFTVYNLCCIENGQNNLKKHGGQVRKYQSS